MEEPVLAAPVAPFRVDVHPERDVVRVAPAGELDLTTVSVVDGQVADLRAAGFGQLVLDLRAVSFMDTTGLQLVLALDAAARTDGVELGLIPGPPAVQRVFELCGVLDRLPFRPLG
jgi:anti-anti-sigma factor